MWEPQPLATIRASMAFTGITSPFITLPNIIPIRPITGVPNHYYTILDIFIKDFFH
jgi:hypothetical protein